VSSSLRGTAQERRKAEYKVNVNAIGDRSILSGKRGRGQIPDWQPSDMSAGRGENSKERGALSYLIYEIPYTLPLRVSRSFILRSELPNTDVCKYTKKK
jgi:hypothetical protein